MKIEIPYYEDNTRISNSAIGWFLKKGPRYLKDMLDGKEEGISAKYLDKGTMIHMYLLQPDEFWHNYIVIDYEKPKTAQQTAFCERYHSSAEIVEEDKLLDAYKFAYSGNNMSKDAMLMKAKELQLKFAEYIEALEKTDLYTIISFADLNMLKNIKDPSLYRVHADGCRYKNYGFINDLNTISGYYSITSKFVTDTVKSY